MFVKTGRELVSIIKDECLKRGNDADLNHIDVSAIKSFTYLFMLTSNLAFDISQWDVHNATHFNRMFYKTTFSDTFDIRDWDTQNAENMDGMFLGSNFNGNISDWNVKKVESMQEMFAFSTFNGDISKWDVSNVKFFTDMFNSNKFFCQDITSWKLKSATNMKEIYSYRNSYLIYHNILIINLHFNKMVCPK